MISTFVFYDKASGPQAWLGFSKEFKHCNVITFDGEYTVMLEYSKQGIVPRVYELNDASEIILRLKRLKSVSAIITVFIEERVNIPWTPLWIKSCNELNRHITGIDVGITLNPRHLYSKILRYSGHSNFKIDYHWRRKS